MEKAALFCDETIEYRCPEEPDCGDEVRLRFRTAKNNVEHVYLIWEDGTVGAELEKVRTKGNFDYYEYRLTIGRAAVRFYFKIVEGDEYCFYNRLGVSEDFNVQWMFRITPGFHVPVWAKGAVMYQIFIDRFCNGDPTNDVESDEYVYIGFPVMKVDNWEEGLSVLDVDRFYGGDLQGILDKLDYLQSLKVEVLYLNPVFVSPSNHKYDCQDYEHVDPHYGVIVKDNDELVASSAIDNQEAGKYMVRTTARENLEASDAFFFFFLEEVHRRGMRVILDGVFNHCGSFNKWLDREKIYAASADYEAGAYGSESSPYRNFFSFSNENGWPDNESYEGWWDHATLPKLNYEGSDQLRQYILRIAEKWLKPPYSIDGWRLDVAADLGHSQEANHSFWRDFRRTVKAANPEALIIAEHYGDASSWLEGDQWDTVMNYDAFMEPLSWFLTGMEKHSDVREDALYQNSGEFMKAMLCNMSRMQTPSLAAAMNELSNHDHSRFLTRTNRSCGRLDSPDAARKAAEGIHYGIFCCAAVVQMTWPGAPTIYYGDEAGVCGWTDPDNRRTFPWGKENLELVEFHKYLTGIRKQNPAFRNGCFKPLLAEEGLISYARFSGGYVGVVLVNSKEYPQKVFIPVWLAEVSGRTMERVMESSGERYNAGRLRYPVENGMMEVEIGAFGAMIFEEKNT